MSKPIKSVFVYFLFLVFACPSVAKQNRFVDIQLKDKDGAHEVTLYKRSYALVIGIDQYMDPAWPVLSNAVNDAKAIANELEKHGFSVQLTMNLNSRQLKKVIEEFVIRKGRHPEARLFIWYAGHGHTIEGEGFLVPSDASSPFGADAWKFRLKALSLRRFGEFMRQARAKHVMTIFDSCFSGTVFNTARSKPPPAITKATTRKVRQFVASGEARQVVSDNGLFRKLFLDAISGRDARADMNGDGYVIGSELGLFLHQRVSNLTENRQTPRSGKLNAYGFDLGDFVFRTTKESRRLVEEKKKNALELAYWQSVQKQAVGAAYEAYIQKFPNGDFKDLALLKLGEYARLKKIEREQKAVLMERDKARAKNEAIRQKMAELDAKKSKSEAAILRDELRILRLQQKEDQKQLALQKKRLKSDRKIILANLPDWSVDKLGVSPVELNGQKLVQLAQKQLKRVGCYSGRIDGDWGPRSRSAMRKFNRYSKLNLSLNYPDLDMVKSFKKIVKRICPHVKNKVVKTNIIKRKPNKRKARNRDVAIKVSKRRVRKPKRNCQTFSQCMAICNCVQRSFCGQKCSKRNC